MRSASQASQGVEGKGTVPGLVILTTFALTCSGVAVLMPCWNGDTHEPLAGDAGSTVKKGGNKQRADT